MSFIAVFLFFSTAMLCALSVQGGELDDLFDNPPHAAKPGVYWYFMDGNLSKDGITKDLESMKATGIEHALFLETNNGVPRGPVDFMSEIWLELFTHLVREAERLGISLSLGAGPGWTGSGGPWVKSEQSMQHLVASSSIAEGPARFSAVLPVSPPRQRRYSGDSGKPETQRQWETFYKDVAVLAFPTPSGEQRIAHSDEKALYYRAPYSSVADVAPQIPSSAHYPAPDRNAVVPKKGIVDLTDKLKPDGTLDWDVPEGRWTILRFVSRNNGAVTRPAPYPGIGLECDKFDAEALNAHLEHFTERIFEKTGPPKVGQFGGLKMLHIDSWEMGTQNWTEQFRNEFKKRRGYDPLPFFPAYLGIVVESLEISERFLWDLRTTAQELVLENHVQALKNYGSRYGMGLSIEPYDMNPNSDMDLGSMADVPMCEFWSQGFDFNTVFSCLEATSVAHLQGKPVVAAEAFTAMPPESWQQHPASMKNQTDWAFAIGINRLTFHTFQHQSLDDRLRPGMTMGPFGVQWNRNQTWWPLVGAYHTYLARCQALLQEGRTISDVLYLTPEGAPQVFVPPKSALIWPAPPEHVKQSFTLIPSGESLAVGHVPPYSIPDKKGYAFDGCSPLLLRQSRVRNGRIAFTGQAGQGGEYRLLVLPSVETMTPELLKKIKELLHDGATVVGNPPKKSPSLVDYPACDLKVSQLVRELWGSDTPPETLTVRNIGKGKLISHADFTNKPDGLYPDFDATSALFAASGLVEDFSSEMPVRYTHRVQGDTQWYFLANRSAETVSGNCFFRAEKGRPELWNPATGEKRPLPQCSAVTNGTSIPMTFEPFESFFVVFRNTGDHPMTGENFPKRTNLCTLEGPWTVEFDPKWGGPATTEFEQLQDWSKHGEFGIKYYSGTATYRKEFDLPANVSAKRLWLDLGKVCNMAQVRLNGRDMGIVWTTPWRVEVSDAVKEKDNVLEIDVVNLWPNRLIGDLHMPPDNHPNKNWPPTWALEKRPSGRLTFTTHSSFGKESPLLESGLLGPVTLQIIP